MAEEPIYCTGTITGSDGDGDGSTGDPYQGPLGLEAALDTDVGAGNDQMIYVRDTYTVDQQIEIDTNAADAGHWKKIIGCSGSGTTWTPITALGTYVLFDASAVSGGLAGRIFSTNIINVWIENIHAKDPQGDDAIGSAEGTECCFGDTANSNYAQVFKNCKATGGYRGFHTVGRGVAFIDCVAVGSRLQSIYATGYSTMIIGGFFKPNAAAGQVIYTYNCAFVIGAVCSGGTYGVEIGSSFGSVVMNCSFYNTVTGGVLVGSAGSFNVIMNNIVYVPDTVNDYGIQRSAGIYYEDYNITNALTAGSLSGMTELFGGGNSLDDQTFGATDPFTLPASDNFDLNTGQTEADLCIDGAKPQTNWWD